MIMSPDNNIGAKHGGGGGGGGNKDEANQSSGGGGGGRKTSSLRPPEKALKCPRCDSPNTKFCYYNNYSLTQPRHFCKTCRRYWTKGGALRNVPIGGGCRKNKKALKSSSSSRFSGGDSSSKDSSSDIGGLKFFNGLSPAMDFQLGGLNFPPQFHHSSSFGTTGINGVYNNNSSTTTFGETSSPNCFNLDPLGLNNFPLSSHLMNFKQGGGGGSGGGDDGGDQHGFQEMGIANSSNINLLHNNGSTNNIASSIESLSSINQDLHWKLQQQRLAMLFGDGCGGGGENQRQKETISSPIGSSLEKPQPILFQNLEISKPTAQPMGGNFSRKDGGVGGNLATEWFFDNRYAPVNVNMNSTAPTDDRNVTSTRNENGSNWSGIQAWSNLNQFTLP